MTDPCTKTGSKLATGVILPVLPTWNVTSFNLVLTSSGGNLYAIAHLGYFAVTPISSCISILSTFNTIPSISYGRFGLFSPISLIYSKTSYIVLHKRELGLTLKPNSDILDNASL